MMPIFKLILHRTYHRAGFFNVTVEFDRHVRADEGPVQLMLRDGKRAWTIKGRINRRANPNGTARIMGGRELRDWFQSHFRIKDMVEVDLSSVEVIRLRKARVR
jgi:hypothetical protein